MKNLFRSIKRYIQILYYKFLLNKYEYELENLENLDIFLKDLYQREYNIIDKRDRVEFILDTLKKINVFYKNKK